jgi:predicted permease
MILFFRGFIISTLYGFLVWAIISYFQGEDEATKFLKAYTIGFKTIVSLGLSLGTAFVVLHTRGDIPAIIEDVFKDQQLPEEYFDNRERYESLYRTVNFITQVVVVAALIFWYCRFPLQLPGKIFMILAVCAEYGFASFVGRKLRYAAMMMHSLSDVEVPRNLFKERELDSINWYVNVASTLTMIFVYVHVMFYYKGPFAYDSGLKESIRIFLILPAVMATPVLLIFNFYPREVLRKLYSKSIDVELESLRRKLRFEKLNSFEKRAYLIEFQKMSREELRYSLQLALTDLPIGITILAMVLQTLLKQ